MDKHEYYTEAAGKHIEKMMKGSNMLEDGKHGIIYKATLGNDHEVDYFIEKLGKLEQEYSKTIVNVHAKGHGLVASLPSVSLIDGSDLTGAFSTMRNTLKGNVAMYKGIDVEVTCGTWNAPDFKQEQFPWGDGKSGQFMNKTVPQMPIKESVNYSKISLIVENTLLDVEKVLEKQGDKIIGIKVGKNSSAAFTISEKVTSAIGVGTLIEYNDGDYKIKLLNEDEKGISDIVTPSKPVKEEIKANSYLQSYDYNKSKVRFVNTKLKSYYNELKKTYPNLDVGVGIDAKTRTGYYVGFRFGGDKIPSKEEMDKIKTTVTEKLGGWIDETHPTSYYFSINF